MAASYNWSNNEQSGLDRCFVLSQGDIYAEVTAGWDKKWDWHVDNGQDSYYGTAPHYELAMRMAETVVHWLERGGAW